MIYDTTKINAWLEGEKAYIENKPDTICPYDCDTVDRHMWIQGYQNIKNIKESYNNCFYTKMENT